MSSENVHCQVFTHRTFRRFDTSVTSSYETAGETSNSFDSQICTISSEEAGRISVEVSAAQLLLTFRALI